MEEDDTRQSHRNKGRFGIHTNKTVKYNVDDAWARRKEPDSIVVIDINSTNRVRPDFGVSLNARKNWELIENTNRNSLKKSQDGKIMLYDIS